MLSNPAILKIDSIWKVKEVKYKVIILMFRLKIQKEYVFIASFKSKSIEEVDFTPDIFSGIFFPSGICPESSGLSRNKIKTNNVNPIASIRAINNQVFTICRYINMVYVIRPDERPD